MISLPLISLAWRNLCSRPVRSLLSLLGLSIAIAGMVGLFSVAQGIDRTVSDALERIPGVLVMQPGAPIPVLSRLPAIWEKEIGSIPGVRVVNREIWARAHIIEGKRIISPPRLLFGTDLVTRAQLEHGVFRDDIIEGRFLSPDDAGTYRTVISKPIAEEFKKGVGDILKIDGFDLEIVGIYHCRSILLDMAIILDDESLSRISRMEGSIVSCFYVEPMEGYDAIEIGKLIRTHFRGRTIDVWDPTNLADQLMETGGPLVDFWLNFVRIINKMIFEAAQKQTASSQNSTQDAVDVKGAKEFRNDVLKFSADLDVFLLIMTGIGVTIAVLSILNTMLMSVSERFIEFGILKANGWSWRDVLYLVTIESLLLGISGGVLGSLFGWGMTQYANQHWPNHINLYASPGLLVFSVLFSTFLGVLGGLYPAILAARMLPMDAIRHG